jgi:hypothetical protein
MGASLSKRKNTQLVDDSDDEEDCLVLKKARLEAWRSTDVVVTVGSTRFEECSSFLRCWSGYFEDELSRDPEMTQFEFPNKDPKEWELLKSVFNPFSTDSISKDNYPVLLPWLSKLRYEAGLLETDNVILTEIVEPLIAKEESQRSPEMVNDIVTVLEHCIAWNRDIPRDRCIIFLQQVLDDPSQPFSGNAIRRIVRLLNKDAACQLSLWQMVRYYMPADLAENTSFPKDRVILMADNPMLLDVIVANKKLKKYLYLVELKLKRVVSQQEVSMKADEKAKASASDSQETSLELKGSGDEAEVYNPSSAGIPSEIIWLQ